MPSAAEQNFRRSFDTLLTFALRRGVPFGDAQELVQATIVAALDRFDEGKGAYLGYCTTILGNKIKNYWRDRKPTESIEDVDLPDPDLHDQVEREEERARMKEMINRISRELTSEELAFLKALGIACEEMESRAVSQASRSLGLEPEKGWDVFRRIQRKARTLFPGQEAGSALSLLLPKSSKAPSPGVPESPDVLETPGLFLRSVSRKSPGPPKGMAEVSLSSYSIPGESLFDLARWVVCEESFSYVMGTLTPDQMARLRSLFS